MRGKHSRARLRRRGGRGAGRASLALPVALMVAGLAIACVPLIADLASRTSTHEEVQQVEDAWSSADDEETARSWRQARAYNRVLAGKGSKAGISVLPYERQLVYGIWPYICYVRAGSVGIELPVYHGTSEEVLSAGAGHIEGTSLPVGGKDSNCCISGHSGVSSGAMFDNLRDIEEGDLVTLHTLGRVLGYRVRSVAICDENDTSALSIVPGEDLLTLVTCTSDPMPGMPRGGYGINDRRLVVTCERCALPDEREGASPPRASLQSGRWWPAALALGLSAFAIVHLARRKRLASRTDQPGARRPRAEQEEET